ncbi:uncharacterized protein F4812DRAFT_398350 [Daldinia caldariorum]|uniref:uncharacterized protein n=1 Tax=Daldinia caldariorum TaxID=326644 RepID=UPI0020078693|nr:uncharacterized protein F4812DRAFT_398350 [Daldinia caldariorum]KAI1467462.1 hypothetical protein F4812DRAFT_398350 [Daldinia caldariorum]
MPKPHPDEQGKFRLTSHVPKSLGKSTDSDIEMITLYHNVPCLPLPHIPIEFMFARFAWSIFDNGIIALFSNDIHHKHQYSVLVPEKSGNPASPLVEKIITLKEFIPPQSKATGSGKKRDASHLDADLPDYPMESDLVFSVRTGNFVPYDDPREPGDRGCNRNRYDDSDVCSNKRSRLSIHSDSESECDSALVWHSDGANESEAEDRISEREEKNRNDKTMA